MNPVIKDIASQLQAVYSPDEAEALAWWIMEEMTGLSRTQLQFGHKGTTNFSNLQEIDETISKKVQEIIARLLNHEPIQYIFGHTLWAGLDLLVTPDTLIPRPETAELVSLISHHTVIADRPIRVLDIGTGSGCIAIKLKQLHPEWQVTGIDISPKAIAIARRNAIRNEVQVEFREADIFSDEIEQIWSIDNPTLPFDIVVSNPPYIRECEKATMRPNVLLHEPATALFVPDSDPLRFYRRIASLHLARHLFFEINEAYPAQMQELLEQCHYTDIRLSTDMYGKWRIINACYK